MVTTLPSRGTPPDPPAPIEAPPAEAGEFPVPVEAPPLDGIPAAPAVLVPPSLTGGAPAEFIEPQPRSFPIASAHAKLSGRRSALITHCIPEITTLYEMP